MEGGASGSDKNISHSQSHEARRGPSPHPKEGSRGGFWEQAPRHRGSRDFLGCGEVVKGAVPGSGPARPPPEQGPDSQHVSTLEELSRTLFVHLKGTEVKLPLRNGGGGCCGWQRAGAATIPQPKAPGIQVWEEGENIPSMSLGKQPLTTARPAFLNARMWLQPPYSRGGGERPAPGPWCRPGGPAPAVGPGPRRPRPGQAEFAPRTVLTGPEPQSRGAWRPGCLRRGRRPTPVTPVWL